MWLICRSIDIINSKMFVKQEQWRDEVFTSNSRAEEEERGGEGGKEMEGEKAITEQGKNKGRCHIARWWSSLWEKKHDWNYSTNSIKAWLPSTPGTYQLHPTTDAVRGKTTPPVTTFLAAELNIGKCHSSLGPSLSGMLCRRRSRRPSRWTVSSPGSPISSNSTNPFPPCPLPPPSQIPPCPTPQPPSHHPLFWTKMESEIFGPDAPHTTALIQQNHQKNDVGCINGRRRRLNKVEPVTTLSGKNVKIL